MNCRWEPIGPKLQVVFVSLDAFVEDWGGNRREQKAILPHAAQAQSAGLDKSCSRAQSSSTRNEKLVVGFALFRRRGCLCWKLALLWSRKV